MENQEVQNNSTHSIKWGVILGVVGVIISLTLYLINISMLTSGWVQFASLVISIGLVFYASIDYRKQLGGFMTFGQAFLHCFVVLAISGLIGFIFQYLLFNVIDPEAAKVMAEAQMEATMEAMEAFGGANAEMMDNMEAQTSNQFSAGTLAMGYGFTLIAYAIGAAIVGAITKKKNKELDF